MLKSSKYENIIHKIFIIFIVIWTLLPLYWLGVMSVTPQRYTTGSSTPALTPVEANLDSFSSILRGEVEEDRVLSRHLPVDEFRAGVKNSTIISLVSVLLGLVIGSLAAYSLVRLKFPGFRIIFIIILISRMIPHITLAIPMYSVFQNLGVLDTYIPLIVMYTGFATAFTVLIMGNYFKMLPVELIEAARIDGCSHLGAFARIVLPTAAPGLVSVVAAVFITVWGEFLYALLYTSSIQSRTLPIVISMFVGEFGIDYQLIAASLIISILPPVLMVLFLQKFIISGLTAGSVKG